MRLHWHVAGRRVPLQKPLPKRQEEGWRRQGPRQWRQVVHKQTRTSHYLGSGQGSMAPWRVDLPPPHFISRIRATVPSPASHPVAPWTVVAVGEGLSRSDGSCPATPKFSIRLRASLCVRARKAVFPGRPCLHPATQRECMQCYGEAIPLTQRRALHGTILSETWMGRMGEDGLTGEGGLVPPCPSCIGATTALLIRACNTTPPGGGQADVHKVPLGVRVPLASVGPHWRTMHRVRVLHMEESFRQRDRNGERAGR